MSNFRHGGPYRARRERRDSGSRAALNFDVDAAISVAGIIFPLQCPPSSALLPLVAAACPLLSRHTWHNTLRGDGTCLTRGTVVFLTVQANCSFPNVIPLLFFGQGAYSTVGMSNTKGRWGIAAGHFFNDLVRRQNGQIFLIDGKKVVNLSAEFAPRAPAESHFA